MEGGVIEGKSDVRKAKGQLSKDERQAVIHSLLGEENVQLALKVRDGEAKIGMIEKLKEEQK